MSTDNKVVYTQWLKRGTNTYIPTDNSVTQPKVNAGVYNIRYADGVGYYLVEKELNLDELINLPIPEGREVIESIQTFWKREAKFKEYKYAYKRGVLLYGVPGGGKTCIINLLCKELTEKMDGVVFTISSEDDLNKYLHFMPEIYRMIESTRPIITVIEDIDGLCQYKEAETKLLNALDGIEQLENVVYLATTNYTERLSERLTNRPNRFDRRIQIKPPNKECREMYFKHKLKPADLKAINMEEWVNRTEGMTMAHLGEVVKSVIILGNTFDNTIEILGGMKKNPVSRNYNGGERIGFFANKSEEEENVPQTASKY